jgi:hypothetical protein
VPGHESNNKKAGLPVVAAERLIGFQFLGFERVQTTVIDSS